MCLGFQTAGQDGLAHGIGVLLADQEQRAILVAPARNRAAARAQSAQAQRVALPGKTAIDAGLAAPTDVADGLAAAGLPVIGGYASTLGAGETLGAILAVLANFKISSSGRLTLVNSVLTAILITYLFFTFM